MGARTVSSEVNAKIVASMMLGRSAIEAAKLYGVSDTYCSKLMICVKLVSAQDWEGLLEFSKSYTARTVIDWSCKYLDVQMPPEVAKKLEEVCYRTPPKADNTAAAMVKVLEKLEETVEAITTAADDICQTQASMRKLIEDCINANFDVLNATVRDGFESVKTTIRKEMKK